MSTREHSVQPGRITTPATVVGPSTTDAPTPEQSAADVPARPAPRRPLRRGRKQRTLGELHRPRGQQIALTVLVLAAGLIFLVPIYWLFSGAVKPNEDIYSWPLVWFPTELRWENFEIGRASCRERGVDRGRSRIVMRSRMERGR